MKKLLKITIRKLISKEGHTLPNIQIKTKFIRKCLKKHEMVIFSQSLIKGICDSKGSSELRFHWGVGRVR